jgi:hypothetical protein
VITCCLASWYVSDNVVLEPGTIVFEPSSSSLRVCALKVLSIIYF